METFSKLTPCSNVSIFDFEQVSADWESDSLYFLKKDHFRSVTLHEKCENTEFFLVCIWTEYGD